jgi:glycosyltransferase involved in cell wall biosynthesis
MDVYTSGSSFGEGFSNAIAEAMSCGLPCVVTDVGDARTIVGDLGMVVPPNAPDALAAAWNAVLADPQQRGADARARRRSRIVDQFSDAVMVGRSEAALKQLLDRRRAQAAVGTATN